MTRLTSSIGLALAWALAGCLSGDVADYGDPTNLATPTESDGIVAWLAEPTAGEALDTASPEVVIGAYVEGEDAPLEVRVSRLTRDDEGNDEAIDTRLAVRSGEGDEQRFTVEVGLLHGVNRFLANLQTLDRTRVRRMAFSLIYDGDAPGVALRLFAPTGEGDAPCDDAQEITLGLTNASEVCVRGEVTTREGSRAARVTLSVSPGNEGDTVEADGMGRFESALELPLDRSLTIAASAQDEAGNQTTTRAELVQDSTPPELSISTKARETSAPSLALEGTASDASGVDAVELQADGQTELRAVGADEWSLDVQLPEGTSEFELVARDRAGNENRQPLTLARLRTLWLGPPAEGAGATDLELNRDQIADLLTVENQQDTELVSVDVTPTVREALERIREPERFDVDTSAWGDAERNLQRILAMTSDNADLSGTSLEELLDVAEAVGLPSPRLLAQLLDLNVTQPFIDLDLLAEVVMDQLVGTHPNIGVDGDTFVIEVDLYDVLNDLTTLAPRFGPAGDHPGFLAGESFSPVLEPGFRVTFPVESNLVQYDGVDLSRSTKDFHFLIEGDRVLDFNILSDDFAVVGLQDEPTVDLRFVLNEHPGPGMLAGGSNRTAQPDPDDAGFFRGDGQGWGIDPWLFERIAVEAAYRQFHRRYEADGFQRTLQYDAGTIEDAVRIDWERGWVTITPVSGIDPGIVPDPVYVWDFIMEVAQVRLHDGGLPEGEANMGFTLTEVPIGLTAEELVEKLKPSLNEQEEELSEQLVGELGLATPRAEVFYLPAEGDGPGALAFPAPEDSDAEYAYERPGFYSDPGLTDKVSTPNPVGGVGDTSHEKVPANEDVVYYAEDEEGTVYSIAVVERDGDRIGVRVSEVRAEGGLQ